MRGYEVLVGFALLAAAAAEQRRRRKAPLNPLEQAKIDQALPPAHVGSPGFEWESEGRFPEPVSFQKALRELGYEIELDGDVLTDASRDAFISFQVDWNVVTQAFEIGRPVDPHGYIDVPTIAAIAGALDATSEYNSEWFNIVSESLELLRPEVG